MNETFLSLLNGSTLGAGLQMSNLPTIDQQISVAYINCLQWIAFGIFLCGLGIAIFGMAYWIRTFRGGVKSANTINEKNLGKNK